MADRIARRRRAMGPIYTLFYEEPLHLVRGQGSWLYDADGRAYIDAYNNVPVVGHCHPAVVEAMTRQAGLLNTHTRYMSDVPVELAERLLATMPADIAHVMFTCTGSEANDLAARIAKSATGGTGFIVTENAYHGTSELISGMSPSAGPLGPGIFAVPAPRQGDDPNRFGHAVRDVLSRMEALQVRPAALLVDTIFSSEGVVTGPAGFLGPAVDAVRSAGGLFIADEVQAGLGRTGSHMWGFQRHGLSPDIVTMGKPLGNGHPVAAVAARAEHIAQFGRTNRYFNTFGGNSVACATALAVLDVIAREGLLENARAMGAYLGEGLGALAARHPAIGEIRGAGLFFGVEIRPIDAGMTARTATARIVNGLRREGVLIGSTGREGNALKIRPPLCISRSDIDILVSALDRTLSA